MDFRHLLSKRFFGPPFSQRPGARIAVCIAITTAFSFVLFAAHLAWAGTATITMTGQLTSGTDVEGTFVAAGTSLAGQDYTLVWTINDAVVMTTTAGGPPPTSSDLKNTPLINPAKAAITINGKTVTSTKYAPSAWAFEISQNASNGDTDAVASWNYTVGTDDGRLAFSGPFTFHNPMYANSYNWEAAVNNYVPASGNGTFQFSFDHTTPAGYTDRVLTSDGTILSYTVTGPATITPPGYGVPGKNNGCQCSQTSAISPPLASSFHMTDANPTTQNGDPINAATGNQTLRETDFVGPAPTGLSFTRTYNSYDQSSGALGTGWHSNWHRGLTATTSTSVIVTASDGRQDTFTYTGSNWVSDADVSSVLASTSSGYQLTLPDDSNEFYNSSGQLLSIVTRAGLTTTLSYTTSGLSTVTGPFGHTLTFTYDALNRVSTMKPTSGNTYYYYYDGSNNLSYIDYPTGYVRAYVYDNATFPNLMTSLIDEDGNTYASWTYDGTGRALTSQLGSGANLTTIAYTSTGSSTVTDANGNALTYTLTTLFNVVKPASTSGMVNPASGGAAFSYDANGFISSRTDWDGNITTYVHNAAGEETSRTEAYGTALTRTITTSWNGTWHLPDYVHEPNRTTHFTYDGSGNMLSLTTSDAGGDVRTWSYTYNAKGQVLGKTDPLGNTTSLSYTTSGYISTITNALGQTTTFNSYDADGHVLSVTSPLGLTTTLTYDALGRELTEKTGGLTTTLYWDQGAHQLSEVKYADGSYLLYSYDAAHRLTQISDRAGDTIKYGYDAASNRTSINVYDSSNNLWRTHSYAYDSNERLLSDTGASLSETTTYSRDNNGNVLSIEDPNGHFTQYTFDDLNRPATVEDAYSGITTNGYDAEDNLVSVTDPLNLTTTYTYNGIGDLVGVQSPDTGTTTMSRNALGLLLTTTDARGKSASYQYDALNRTTTISYSGGQVISYLYDTTTYGIGQLGKMIDPAGTTVWTYDSFGDVATKSQTTGSLTLTTTYSYDSDERLSRIQYKSGQVSNYAYDSSGRIASLGLASGYAISSITYFPFGPAKSWTENNGLTYTTSFDQDGRITGIALGGTTSNVQAITYDPAGNLTALSETGTGSGGSKTAAYDSDNRLTSYFNATNTNSFVYDADGNRLSSTVLGTTTTYTYPGTSNRLTNLGGTTTYSYDASGNVTGDGTNIWTYDSRGRMATLTAGTTTAAFGINGFGQRITKAGTSVPSGGTNEFVYDEHGNMVGEYGSTGTMIEETVYLPSTPVAALAKGYGMAGLGAARPVAVLTGSAGATVASVTPDWLGLAHIITNASKQLIWIWDHYAFWDNAPNQNPSGLGTYNLNTRGSYYKDVETNTNYSYLRDIYYPSFGRFGQSDPSGQNGGINTYAYAGSNPLINIDPRGLDFFGAPAPGSPAPYPLYPTDPYNTPGGPNENPIARESTYRYLQSQAYQYQVALVAANGVLTLTGVGGLAADAAEVTFGVTEAGTQICEAGETTELLRAAAGQTYEGFAFAVNQFAKQALQKGLINRATYASLLMSEATYQLQEFYDEVSGLGEGAIPPAANPVGGGGGGGL